MQITCKSQRPFKNSCGWDKLVSVYIVHNIFVEKCKPQQNMLKLYCPVRLCWLLFYIHHNQTTESRSDDTSLSTTPNRSGIMAENIHRQRSLAIEIRNQQHLRISGGSLPSNFQSAHVRPLSGSSRHRRPLNSTSRLHSMHRSYRIGKSHAFEPESSVAEDEATASLPNSFEVNNW
jgi:hypothetical protein